MSKLRLSDFYALVIVLISLILTVSCEPKKEIIEDIFLPRYDHEAYLHKLEIAGILGTALGKEWSATAQKAIDQPMIIEAPFAEDLYISETEASGMGYRFGAMKGHKVEIQLESRGNDETELFLDVFRVDSDSLGEYTHVASADDSLTSIIFEPQYDAEYILRFQTELLRGGHFTITIINVPSLAFPVAGKSRSAIGSLFGAPRDAGRRKHHGIDIFARRHTPVIAPCDGYVRSTKDNKLGGRVVWLRDSKRGQTLYFAHLQDVLVEEGANVVRGDTIGTVGNSGNARTTAPHLHFGIYKSGPMDPYHFVVETRTKLKRALADRSLVGQLLRTNKDAKLKTSGLKRRANQITLPKHQIIKTMGASASYFRVKLPDDTEGYIAYNEVEGLDKLIGRAQDMDDRSIYARPDAVLPMGTAQMNVPIKILGKHSDYYYAEGEEGQQGWIKAL